MAQSYVTDAGTLIIPSAVSSIQVATSNSGLGTTGVLMLVGEAESGPDFSLEDDLQSNSFGPDQVAAVLTKYQAGPLVDAFRAAAQPANDPNIQGSPSRVILVKTNVSARAKSALTVFGDGAYNSADSLALSLADRSYGKLGNLIYYTIDEKVTEVLPTTGAFTWLLPIDTVHVAIRVNGGAALTANFARLDTPTTFVSTINGLAGVSATGGVSRGILGDISGNIALTVLSGATVRIDYDEDWDGTNPVAGDTLYIPEGSTLAGGADQNAGSYVVTSSTDDSITARKLQDASGLPGTLTLPLISVVSGLVIATTDIQVWSPVVITLEAGNPSPGVGKSLEIAELTTGVDVLSNSAYALSSTKVTWVSKASGAKLLTSGAEYKVQLNINRQRDNIQEELAAGGEIALKISYTGTTATLTIDDTSLTTTVVDGTGDDIDIDLKDFPTISDVATYINSKAGYKATVGTAILGQLPSTALDNVTAMGICSQFGEYNGRLKIDAYRFYNKVNGESVLVQILDSDETNVQAGGGLPQPVTDVTYLDGGLKGATTDASVTAALLALEKVRGNFLVPLFSRDASSDKADSLTDDGSTYTIAGINAACRTHVLKLSTLKRRRNRQAFLSYRDSFANAKEAASNTASFRCSMVFQDIKGQGSDGSIKQFQPWMGAVLAAGMQAAGFYRPIVHKYANVSGALQGAKDYNDQDDSATEDALLAGLLPLRKAETGGYYWVSDQTTYGKDNNFVFNSIQATYVADVIALTTATRMENAFVGQSVADISAALAMAFLESIMEDFKRLKLISASDDAPAGFKNASIKISGTAMIVSVEVKLAGALYFIPISFLVSQVQQTA